MSSDPLHPTTDSADSAWQEIDTLLDEIARLSKSEGPPTEFHAECLRRVVTGLGAAGGIVWMRGPSGRLRPDSEMLPSDLRSADPRLLADHERLVASVLADGGRKAFPAGAATASDASVVNSSEFLLLVAPWTIGSEAAGAVEVFQRPGASPKTQEGYLEFLQVVAELTADFHRRRQLSNYRLWAADLKRMQDFAAQVHRSLDLQETAYAVANEGRRLAECDRLSVLERRGARCRLLAVSGVATVSPRANAVRQLERLAAVILAQEEPLWFPDPGRELAPEIEQAVQAYLDESHARSLAVYPLRPPTGESDSAHGQPMGALVAERFYGPLDEPLRWNLSAMGVHSALALHHARQLQRVPFLRLLSAVSRAGGLQGGRRLKVILVLLALCLGVTALAVIPADFGVEARGELQPVRVRDVFAPTDGVVVDLRIRHGQQVAPGEILAVLRRAELDLEFKRVWGELQTARRRLASIEAERIQGRREIEDQRQRYGQLTAQQEELREQITGLEAQYAILQQQQAELEVRSPMAGEVLTWSPQQLLDGRPVGRGQVLMTVGDLRGPWQLELRIPDRRVAHVLRAQRELSEQLQVSFIQANDLGRASKGTLSSVGRRTEISDTEGAFVLATVAVTRDEIPQLIPGAGVAAKIHCGRRAAGYVWFHDLIDAVRGWLLF